MLILEVSVIHYKCSLQTHHRFGDDENRRERICGKCDDIRNQAFARLIL
jgi:hypothetical protein